MKTRLVPIGNSKGVRIPQPLLTLCRISSEVDLAVKGQAIIIRPLKRRPRTGWEAAFQRIHERREDRLLIADQIDLDSGSWEW